MTFASSSASNGSASTVVAKPMRETRTSGSVNRVEASSKAARSGSANQRASVCAVVVTYNRKDLLLECLEGLASQRHRLSSVVLVDNASTDGTTEAVASSELVDRLPIFLVPLARNGGGSEGFHAGIAEALRHDPDWIWTMDDDSVPRADTLATLLAAGAAQSPSTVAVVPVVEAALGGVQAIHSGGNITMRLAGSIFASLPPESYAVGEHRIEYFSFMGPLIRANAVRAGGLPRREFFVWMDDVDFSTRLARLGELWVVADARIVHNDGRQANYGSFRKLLGDYLTPVSPENFWKYGYGLRNLLAWGRESGRMRPWHAASYTAVYIARSLLFDRQKVIRCKALLAMARDGWSGRFRTVPPAAWKGIADEPSISSFLNRHALTYEPLPAAISLGRRDGDVSAAST